LAKITLSRLFEVSKYLTTDSGKELKGALIYLSEFVEVSIRNLRNGLTFEDNFDVTSKTVKIRSESENVVLTGEKKRVKEVIARRIIDDIYYVQKAFGWRYNAKGDLVVTVELADRDGAACPTTRDVNIDLLIHFG